MRRSDRRPTLVNVVHSLDPGGAERLVVDMSLEFSDEFRVLVFCLDKAGAWAETLRENGIPVFQLRRQPGLDVYLAFRLARKLREVEADIVHAHQTAPWFYSALSRVFFSGPKLLFQEHGRHYPEPDSRLHRVLNRALISRLTHEIVAVSKDIRERLVRYEGLERADIAVIYNGGRASIAPSASEIVKLREGLGFADGDIVIGFVGRLDPVKNVSMLIQSIKRLESQYPDLRCLIVGDGDEMEKLTGETAKLGLADKVVFAGYRSDADKLIHCMDVFVLPSLSEGTSMALLEAMSANVPVVVTNVGGNIELIEDGVSGHVVASESVTELADAIGKYIDSPDKGKRMAAAAKERFEQQFSFQSMIDGYRELYSSPSLLGSREDRRQAN